MKTSDFDFELPNELIASHPLPQRDASRMLVVNSSPPVEGCGEAAGWSFDNKYGTYFNLPFNPNLKQRARELRKSGSLPEALLWKEIKNKKLNGLDFDRQKIIGNYIVDFFCPTNGIVIEIDDTSHEAKVEYDIKRDKYLKDFGLHVIHLTAQEVLKNPNNIFLYLQELLKDHPAPAGHPSTGGELADCHIRDFINYIQPGDVVVFNNSRVIPARFNASGYEITLHTKVDGCATRSLGEGWWGLCKKFNKINIGDILKMDDGTEIKIIDKNDESGLLIEFNCENIFDVLNRVGKMPLPPYMNRADTDDDRERYQTVYAQALGSMAAPTAGLHFTDEMLEHIAARGAKIVNITLHVGAGTWMPVKTEDLSQHKMHSEWGKITADQAATINAAKRVIAVGTTSLRLLESAACLPPLAGGVSAQPSQCLPPPAGGVPTKWARGVNRCTANAQSFAKVLRKKMTMYECLLWKNLKKSPGGFSFRKQHPIGKYIVDFINLEHRLIIELDGNGHGTDGQIRHDAVRDKFLTDSGYRIIRFWNSQVYKKMQMVLDTIYHYLTYDDIPDLQDFYPAEIVLSPPSALRATPPAGGVRQARVTTFSGTTDIFITPGYKFRVVDVLLTNFHLPKSTLLMLVSAFAGVDEIRAAYQHAVAEKYRFFSYGDCCLLFRNKKYESEI